MTAAALAEALTTRAVAALRLAQLVPPLLALLDTHDPVWSNLAAAHESAAVSLLRLARACGHTEAPWPSVAKRDAALAPLLTAHTARVLLATSQRGTARLTGAAAACLAELCGWPGWHDTFLGLDGAKVRMPHQHSLASAHGAPRTTI